MISCLQCQYFENLGDNPKALYESFFLQSLHINLTLVSIERAFHNQCLDF